MKIIKTFLFVALLSVTNLLFAAQVNINTADAETLSSALSGVGQSKAQAIVTYRENHGPYEQIEDLVNVKGIGVNTVEKNKAVMTVK